jgi:hypothetical protein
MQWLRDTKALGKTFIMRGYSVSVYKKQRLDYLSQFNE